MKRSFVFLIIVILLVVHLCAVEINPISTGTGDGNGAEINVLLKAGNAGGVFVGFSSSEVNKNTPVPTVISGTEMKLTLTNPQAMTDITASGSCYAYWIFKKADSSYDVKIKWEDNNNLFCIFKNSDYSTDEIVSGTVIGTVAGTTDEPVTVYSSQGLYIKTEDLRNKIYGETYTIELTLEAVTK